ncbi:SDR family NAD(P)-dependent oxidoreductase [Dyadobacter fermentans]|uniref:Short-chain dehydrogenase/reductase SDR n=1 Tax=Dyadobacter fermentans (strain ATCC 700827 / DSM 18053 / CIP 107007 / KCTC 52180 / NS114) TaxID=471854 RepID=C6W675_DYAFD|nr:SDR family NAD(P)-dependent oxidoreductase [Dyadobacter fermentans]ACT92555.1 short-chain dehydrogenase/reductase SDR [Dyadobacter fermentans DSM 18053]
MSKTIFITGASKGFGRIWTEAFLERGDKVAATARNTETLADLAAQYPDTLLPIQLNVNDRAASFTAVNRAAAHFGSLDVVINNAGYGLFGAIEETSEQQARDQIETNVFGLLWVTQAAIPVMRAQGGGHILQVSSVLGVATLPVLGLYNASKWAVEGLSETLASEVKDFGIKVTIVEPNGFSTDWGGASAFHTEANPLYEDVKASLYAGLTPDTIGKPEATAEAILKVVDEENPPLRIFLGKVGFPWLSQVYADRLATWEEWKEVADAAHGHATV